MNHQIVAAFLFSLSLGLPSYAAAGIDTTTVDAKPTSQQEKWVARITSANQAVDQANARYAAAVRAYGSMRHRRNDRGPAKATIVTEQEEARAAVTLAARNLEETLEAARRAGVPPGWVREALARIPASGAQTH